MKTLILVTCYLFTSYAYSNERVAKIIIMRGDVKAKMGKKVINLKKGMWLKEGAVVKTSPKSFAKLLFIDKSSMNIGPESQMKIDSFPKKEAGIITLVKGQIRSKVTKNYMEMTKGDKSKLFIKTKSAAMGVRGTDFQVNYNPINESTSLVTFSGAVAMAKLDAKIASLNNRRAPAQKRDLEKIVSSDQAVIVKKGQYSGVSPKAKRVTTPIKISPTQLESMKKQEGPASISKAEDAKPKKIFKSVIPPGMNAKSFSNDNTEMESTMTKVVGKETINDVKQQLKAEAGFAGNINSPPPEGSYNSETGEIAPTAGGFIDLKTAQYIPPPAGSQFDPNLGVYIPPPGAGRIDPNTGNYINDHYQLNPDGTFIAKNDSPNVQADGRSPSSTQAAGGSEPPPPPAVGPMPTQGGADLAFDNPNFIPQPGVNDPRLTDGNGADFENDICTDCLLDDIARDNEERLLDPNFSGRANVRFIIDVQ